MGGREVRCEVRLFGGDQLGGAKARGQRNGPAGAAKMGAKYVSPDTPRTVLQPKMPSYRDPLRSPILETALAATATATATADRLGTEAK